MYREEPGLTEQEQRAWNRAWEGKTCSDSDGSSEECVTGEHIKELRERVLEKWRRDSAGLFERHLRVVSADTQTRRRPL